jgi:hypothetical protein
MTEETTGTTSAERRDGSALERGVMAPVIACRDGCGAKVPDGLVEGNPAWQNAGWSWMPITNSYRCGACEGALWRARGIDGARPTAFVDTLPPDSRGALKRETASSILPPTVRG